jgi:hypothetical protein
MFDATIGSVLAARVSEALDAGLQVGVIVEGEARSISPLAAEFDGSILKITTTDDRIYFVNPAYIKMVISRPTPEWAKVTPSAAGESDGQSPVTYE